MSETASLDLSLEVALEHLVLESLESALERKATIYAEVLGGDINSGGQRNGGTLTAPNSEARTKMYYKRHGRCTDLFP